MADAVLDPEAVHGQQCGDPAQRTAQLDGARRRCTGRAARRRAGIADAARSCGAEHIRVVLRNEHGTPRLDDGLCPRGRRRPRAVSVASSTRTSSCSMTSCRPSRRAAAATRDVPGRRPDDRPPGRDRRGAGGSRDDCAHGRPKRESKRGAAAIDYFVFPAGLFEELPPFLVGRAGFDNWLVWRARQVGPVIDASASVLAIHQSARLRAPRGGMSRRTTARRQRGTSALAGGRDPRLHDARREPPARRPPAVYAGITARCSEPARRPGRSGGSSGDGDPRRRRLARAHALPGASLRPPCGARRHRAVGALRVTVRGRDGLER